MCKNII